MKFLIEHGEKLVALVFLAFSGYLIYDGLATGGDSKQETLAGYQTKITDALRTNTVDKKDRFAQRPDLSELVENAFDRPNQAVKETLASNILYPLPVRPYVDKKLLEADVPKEVKYTISDEVASMKPPPEFSVKAVHGMVYIVCATPSKDIDFKYFTPVRIEYYRGTDENKVTEKLGEYWIELPSAPEKTGDAGKEGAEDPEMGVTDEEKKKALADAGLGTKTLERGADPKKPKTTAKPPKDVAKKEAPPPEETKDIIFPDRDVQPKTKYYYCARLIGRLQDLGPDSMVVNEETKQKIKVKLAEGLKPVAAPAGDKAKYYASEFTPVSSDTVPANYELRFAGHTGDLDKAETAERFRTYSYQGQFEVKVWIPEIQDWGKDFVFVRPKDELTGAVGYKAPDNAVKQVYKFETGLKLVEIRTDFEEKPILTKKTVMEEVEDEDGNKVTRPKRDANGQIVTVEEQSGTMRVPTEVAVVEEIASGKREDVPKKLSFETKQKLFMHYDKLLREREERIRSERAKLKEQIEKKEGDTKAPAPAPTPAPTPAPAPKAAESKTEAPAPTPK
ncbi:MAG: hypothetical protein L6R28_21740 [Planctomycetes bacterium]|nr:hypothetical protein [Planctomycetota bacterium]